MSLRLSQVVGLQAGSRSLGLRSHLQSWFVVPPRPRTFGHSKKIPRSEETEMIMLLV